MLDFGISQYFLSFKILGAGSGVGQGKGLEVSETGSVRPVGIGALQPSAGQLSLSLIRRPARLPHG